MVRRSELIKEIRDITAAVADAMAAVSLFVGYEADERDALGGCKFEADVIRDSYPLLRKRLYEVLDCIKEDWNTVIQNDLLCGEVKGLIEVCRTFHRKAFEFDEAMVVNPRLVEGLLGDAWMPRAYLVLMCEWEVEASAIREHFERKDTVEPRLDDACCGITSKLRRFFLGVTDDEFRAFVMNGVSLKNRPIWKEKKREAVVMGRMLGKTCAEMNESFRFLKNDGEPTRLKYSSHGTELDMHQYEIYPVLKPVMDEKSKRKG